MSGARAQQSGASFQLLIDRSNEWYAARSLAALEEIPVKTVGPSHARQFAAGTGKLDFIGLVVDPVARVGVPVMLDAKVTTGKATLRLSHDDPRERKRTADQVRRLRRYKRMGGLAGYLCLDREIGERGALFWLDADVLAPFESTRYVIGLDDPDIPIRSKHPRGIMSSGHPWCELPTDRDVTAGRCPDIPWRGLVLGLPVDCVAGPGARTPAEG